MLRGGPPSPRPALGHPLPVSLRPPYTACKSPYPPPPQLRKPEKWCLEGLRAQSLGSEEGEGVSLQATRPARPRGGGGGWPHTAPADSSRCHECPSG